MIHARSDYQDRFPSDPGVNYPNLLAPGCSPIGADEPVFLIRAKDKCSRAALLAWADECDAIGGESSLSDHVRGWAQKMTEWQEKNGCKKPDVPTGVLK